MPLRKGCQSCHQTPLPPAKLDAANRRGRKAMSELKKKPGEDCHIMVGGRLSDVIS